MDIFKTIHYLYRSNLVYF